MAAVERVEYMDNFRNKALEETIIKEKRIQQAYFKSQAANGLIQPQPPTPAQVWPSLVERVGLPPHLAAARAGEQGTLGVGMSRHMWISNPGYLVRDGQRLTSVAKQDYIWDDKEIALMKSEGMLSKQYARRQDTFTQYVEAQARQAALNKKTKTTA